MSDDLKSCPFCQCAMQIKTSYGGQMIDGDHKETCVFFGSTSAAFCRPGQDLLNQMVNRWNTRAPELKAPVAPVASVAQTAKMAQMAQTARRHVCNALDIVGQIRQGSNVPSSELWTACEYLDNALVALPRPA